MGPTHLNKVKKSYCRGPQTLAQRQKLATIWYDRNRSTRQVEEGAHGKEERTLEEYLRRQRGVQDRTKEMKRRHSILSFQAMSWKSESPCWVCDSTGPWGWPLVLEVKGRQGRITCDLRLRLKDLNLHWRGRKVTAGFWAGTWMVSCPSL